MDYYARSYKSDFWISKENVKKMIEHFKNLHVIFNRVHVETLFEKFGFTIRMDKDGNIVDIFFCHGIYCYDEVESFLREIYVFVNRGSFISFMGEDDFIWAYYFGKEYMELYTGEIVFPGMPKTLRSEE